MNGSVYFAQRGNGGAIKIGYSTNVAARLASLRTGLAEGLTLLLAVPGSLAEERMLHGRFAKYRLEGEWFRAGDALVDYIAARRRGVPLRAPAKVAPLAVQFLSPGEIAARTSALIERLRGSG